MAPEPDAGILRAAEADLAHARRLLDEHLHGLLGGCDPACAKCASLRAHVYRAQRQVRLLTPAQPEMQELF